jgi:hypothetical protein
MEEKETWSEIPPIFWSDLLHAPFNKCIQCSRNLLEPGVIYLIEKALKGFNSSRPLQTVFEYAICIACAESMRMTLSVESRANIEEFYRKNIDFKVRKERLIDKPKEEWLKECLIKKTALDENGECQIYGLCNGKYFNYQDFPYMISAKALDEVVDLISAKTMDELEDFKNNLTSGPPELRELFEKGGVRVLI